MSTRGALRPASATPNQSRMHCLATVIASGVVAWRLMRERRWASAEVRDRAGAAASASTAISLISASLRCTDRAFGLEGEPPFQIVERHHDVLAVGWPLGQTRIPSLHIGQPRPLDVHREVAEQRRPNRDVADGEALAGQERPAA